MKVNSRRLRSQRRVCQHKVPLDLDNAQEYLLAAQKDTTRYKNPESLELYLCVACGYLHIGHEKGKKYLKANPVEGEEKNVRR
jgi:hypothetical protein